MLKDIEDKENRKGELPFPLLQKKTNYYIKLLYNTF